MSNRTMGKDLTAGNISRVLLTFAWPVMMANLLQTTYGIVDMMIVGNYTGQAGLSAVSSGNDIMNFFLMAGNGLATAGQVMVSQFYGANRKNELNRLIGTLFASTMILGLILTGISVVFLNQMLHLVNTPAEAWQQTHSYLLLCSIGLTFIFGYNMVAAILRGLGDSRHPMMFIGYAAIMNIILDYLFIRVLSFGASGAALATAIAQGTSFFISMIYLYRNRQRFFFDFSAESFRIQPDYLSILVKLGIPLMIQSSASSLSNIYVRRHINPYGIGVSAVTGVGNKLNNVALIVCNALNTSGAAMIGQCYSSGNMDRVKGVFYRVFVFDLIFVSLMATGVLLFPQQIFALFNKSDEVMALAGQYAPVLALAFMAYAFRSPSLALVNGMGNPTFNFVMGVVEGFIMRIGLSYLLGVVMNLGVYGFWYGSVIASYGYGLVVFPYFFSGKWKNRKNFITH